MPLHQPVEEAPQRRQMQVPLGGRAAQADEVLADHARRDCRQLDPLPLRPGQEPLHRRHVGFLRVRVVVLGVEEFIPGEAARWPGPLDQRGQGRFDFRGKGSLAAGRNDLCVHENSLG